jgi:regulator of protease activity HflC (stomatin/prohibitin superfamily)
MSILSFATFWPAIAIVAVALLAGAIKILREYERGVIFRLGRLVPMRGPGLFFLIPFIEHMVRIDLRTVTFELPAQEVITRDNVTLKVTAVLYFHIEDPNSAVTKVANYMEATVQLGMTTLRDVLGQSMLDELLAERAALNQRLQQIIGEHSKPWGVLVSLVEIKDVELPAGMQRAMARQAEAEREKRAKVIHAQGELQASTQLAEAAAILERQPMAMQLRYLATLTEIAAEKNSTIVFPLPIDLLAAFLGREKQPGAVTFAQELPAANKSMGPERSTNI